MEEIKLIVSGDFNFKPSNYLYTKLLDITHLVDPSFGTDSITVFANNTTSWKFNLGLKFNLNKKIDYTLVSKDLAKDITQKVIFDELSKIKNKEIHLSDHFGLLTSLKI